MAHRSQRGLAQRQVGDEKIADPVRQNTLYPKPGGFHKNTTHRERASKDYVTVFFRPTRGKQWLQQKWQSRCIAKTLT